MKCCMLAGRACARSRTRHLGQESSTALLLSVHIADQQIFVAIARQAKMHLRGIAMPLSRLHPAVGPAHMLIACVYPVIFSLSGADRTYDHHTFWVKIAPAVFGFRPKTLTSPSSFCCSVCCQPICSRRRRSITDVATKALLPVDCAPVPTADDQLQQDL